jgi:bifunctional DNA-binding transcriptional regulator/antitoxin component of YhaV-PrlF toxin-antitoxin module
MVLAHSKIAAQGQTSVPSEVRTRLGVGPGSLLQWAEQGDQIVVRRAGRYSSSEIHAVAFPDGVRAAPKRTTAKGIRQYVRKRHARD